MAPDPSAHIPLEALLSEAGWLRALARSLVNDPATAEDLVQETWLAALQHPPSADRPLRPWLRTVLENFARMRRRGEGARAARERATAAPESGAADAELVDRVEEQRFLAREVLKLEEPYRSTLVLRFYEGLSSIEIAKRLESNDNTVRWRLKRGLELLRERLDRRHGGDRRAWTALLAPLVPGDVEPLGAAHPTAAVSSSSAAAWLGAAALLGVLALLWFQRAERGLVETPLVAVVAPPNSIESALDTAGQRIERESASTPAARAPIVARATGHAVDREGAPLEGVEVRMRSSPSSDESRPNHELRSTIAARTAPNGAFTFELTAQEVDAAVDELELSAPGFTTRKVYAPVRPGADLALGELVLSRTAHASGSVVNAAGEPLAKASVQFEVLGSRWTSDREPPLTEVLNTGILEWGATSATATDRDGFFEHRELAAGYYRVWAHAPGFEVGCTAPLPVLEGARLELAPLVLGRPAPERTIRGIVLDVRGAPVVGAQVEGLRSSLKREFFRGRAGAISTSTDERGRFELGAEPGGNYEVAARAGSSFAFAPWKVGSAGELRLVLVERPWLELAFTGFDPGGDLSVWHGDSEGDLRVQKLIDLPVERRGGATLVQVECGRPFRLRIQRGEFDVLSVPLDPERLPKRLELDLPSPKGLDVLVTAYGAPVGGAVVALEPSLSSTHWRERVLRCTTDAIGRASVSWAGGPLRRVRVDADGFALFEAPAGWRHSGSQIHVELSRGGELEGVVRAFDGHAVRGASLLLERADGARREAESDLKGRYRIDALAPGEWSVQLAPPTVLKAAGGGAQLDAPARAHDRIAVVDGATLRRDYTLPGPPQCRLQGRWTLDGAPSGPRIAELARPGKKRVLARAWLDPSGAFELAVDEAGEYELRLDSLLANGSRSEVRQTLRLVRGATEFKVDERTATLVLGLQGAPSNSIEFVVRTTVSSGGEWSTLGSFDSEGRARATLPAGRCELRIDGRGPLQLDLRAGETREIRLSPH